MRRFFALELLDRSFALAAQAFVALLPLVIVVVSAFVTDSAETISNSIGDRFGLDNAARTALRVLFDHPGTAAISWIAILISLLSAFSLARRLARTYAVIFEVPPLPRSKSWHGLVWIVLQVTLFVVASLLRDLRQGSGILRRCWPSVGLLALWFAADVAGPSTAGAQRAGADDGRLGRRVQPRRAGHRRVGVRLHAALAVAARRSSTGRSG